MMAKHIITFFRPICRYWAGLCLTAICISLIQGCVDPFVLPESTQGLDLLVIDGRVEIEKNYVQVKLTRTQNLADGNKSPKAELGAQVYLENAQGIVALLFSIQSGVYARTGVGLQYGADYRLRVVTRSGKEYLSAFVATGKTPPIENVSWQVEQGKMRLQVSTQDPQKRTRYYQWEYTETFLYNAALESNYIINQNGFVVRREPINQIFNCWKTNESTAVLLKSTANQEQDKVSDFVLASFEGDGPRFSRRYSMLVRQYAISREEYEYQDMLRKNTENVGTLFDAQPSYVTGNFTCVNDPEEPVFGYFSVRSLSQKRLFIEEPELRPFQFRQKFPVCEVIEPVGSIAAFDKVEIITEGSPLGIVRRECADCREQGGVTQRPDFW